MSTQSRLSGRDENGFLLGSPMARQATRYSSDGERIRDDKNRARRERSRPRLEADLICPEEVTREARLRASRAARSLGVEVPDWADGWSNRR